MKPFELTIIDSFIISGSVLVNGSFFAGRSYRRTKRIPMTIDLREAQRDDVIHHAYLYGLGQNSFVRGVMKLINQDRV